MTRAAFARAVGVIVAVVYGTPLLFALAAFLATGDQPFGPWFWAWGIVGTAVGLWGAFRKWGGG